MAAVLPEDPLDDIPEFGLFPETLKVSHVPDPTPVVDSPDLLHFLLHSMAGEGSPKVLNEAEVLCESFQEPNAKNPFSRFLANSHDLDIVEQRGPACNLQRGPSLLQRTSEPNEDDKFESENRVNSTASGNSRSEVDRSRGKNIGRRASVQRPAHSGNTESTPDENVEIQQNKAQKRKVPTLDPVSEVRRRSLIIKKITSELASEELASEENLGRKTIRKVLPRRKIIPPLKHWLGQGYIYEACPGKPAKVVGWKEVSFKEADNVYKWEEMRFQNIE